MTTFETAKRVALASASRADMREEQDRIDRENEEHRQAAESLLHWNQEMAADAQKMRRIREIRNEISKLRKELRGLEK